MPKIRITRGVYGHSNGLITEPKDKNSDPFEVSEKKAKELITAGIAELATPLKSEADKPIRYTESLAPVDNLKNKTEQKSEQQNNAGLADTGFEQKPYIEYSMKNKWDELADIAKGMGLEVNDTMTKAEIITLLDDSLAEEAPGIDDDGVVD